MPEKVKKFLTPFNILIASLLVVAFYLRVYGLDRLLAFHYDQGRDALVVWDLIHKAKLFLIGPTTGIAGLFRGPFYYYLIAPFYFLGNGNPVWPQVFLSALSVSALFLMYSLASEISGKKAGVVALILGTFSYEVIYASRWLSNPTPMLFLSMAMVWSMFKILDGKDKIGWPALSLVLGLSFFNFGSSGELFYFPAVLVFAILFRKFPKSKTLLYSLILFFVTFLPLVLFNAKHGGILLNNLTGIMGGESSFGLPTWKFLADRMMLVIVYLTSTIFHNPFDKECIHLISLGSVFVFYLNKFLENKKLKVVLLLLASPLFGLVFFKGNYGNIYQYYLTGYFLIFLLAVAVTLVKFFESSFLGKLFVPYFLVFFLMHNMEITKTYLSPNTNSSDSIVLVNQKEAIDWIYTDAKSKEFNVDVYVPPVISYSYDYLFKWLGDTEYSKSPMDSRVPLLYTLYETDPPHPERLKAWLDRQKGIGKVIKQKSFGGITVEARERLTE